MSDYFELGALHAIDIQEARVAELEAENERLRELHHQIYEVWAGSEGRVPSTAGEDYLTQLIEEMRDLAAEGKNV